jgi:adenylosuccinate lyase
MGGHSMLARTHGQPASPTRLGKEIVFVERLEEQMRLLFNIPFAAKFGGATEITMHIMWLIHNRLEKIWRNLC